MTWVLRAALLLFLGILVVFSDNVSREPVGLVLRIDTLDATALRGMATAPPRVIVRTSEDPPTAAEIERLRAAAAFAPLLLSLRSEPERLSADLPGVLRATRTAGVAFRLHGPSGDTALVRLSDAAGILDSARVVLDSAGDGGGGVRVRPRTAGWHEWTLSWEDQTRTVGAWADSAGPPRVLVHAGLPGWETRFLVRALEESGASVRVRYELGRGLAVGDAPAGITRAALADADVMVVADGAPLTAAASQVLADWAAAGGGVLLLGDRAGAGAFGLVGTVGAATPLSAASIQWDLPPELTPLPPSRLNLTAASLGGPLLGSRVMAAAGSRSVLVARPMGRGRAAGFAVIDSWRWRMEAGAVAQHRELWRTLIDQLAGGTGSSIRLSADPALAAVGAPVEITAWPAASVDSMAVRVAGPAAVDDEVVLRRAADGLLHGRYVAATAGVHRISAAGATDAGFRAGDVAGGWAAASLIAHASGGAALPRDSIRARARGFDAGKAPWRPSAGLLLAIVVVLAGAEWTLRRLRGQP